MILEQLKEIRIEDYTYFLPEDRIARYPLARRDESRLLIYRPEGIEERIFRDTPRLLPASSLLVFNNTKVIHARIFFRKATGALIEVFCLEPLNPVEYVRNFAAIGSCEWQCMVGNLKRWKEGEICCDFEWEGVPRQLKATRLGLLSGGNVQIRFEWDIPLAFSEVLELCGRLPIPPYLNRDTEAEDEIRYQTVYSRIEGSVAAPTAGLHFTEEVLGALRDKGVATEELTLHVGAGTFKPVKSETIGQHDMHTEMLLISRRLVEALLARSGEVVAVGTTSVRTLESLYWMGVKRLEGRSGFNRVGQWEAYELPAHYRPEEALRALLAWFEEEETDILEAQTTIIIVPGYRFRVVSALFTNFHQPQSTLLLLVAAAVGKAWREIYDYALVHGFRFLSYGDSCFLPVTSC